MYGYNDTIQMLHQGQWLPDQALQNKDAVNLFATLGTAKVTQQMYLTLSTRLDVLEKIVQFANTQEASGNDTCKKALLSLQEKTTPNDVSRNQLNVNTIATAMSRARLDQPELHTLVNVLDQQRFRVISQKDNIARPIQEALFFEANNAIANVGFKNKKDEIIPPIVQALQKAMQSPSFVQDTLHQTMGYKMQQHRAATEYQHAIANVAELSITDDGIVFDASPKPQHFGAFDHSNLSDIHQKFQAHFNELTSPATWKTHYHEAAMCLSAIAMHYPKDASLPTLRQQLTDWTLMMHDVQTPALQ
jgi:hypothetical protein